MSYLSICNQYGSLPGAVAMLTPAAVTFGAAVCGYKFIYPEILFLSGVGGVTTACVAETIADAAARRMRMGQIRSTKIVQRSQAAGYMLTIGAVGLWYIFASAADPVKKAPAIEQSVAVRNPSPMLGMTK